MRHAKDASEKKPHAAPVLVVPQANMSYQVVCRLCRQKLSRVLKPVPDGFKPVFSDKKNIIPAGQFWIASGLSEDLNQKLLIHLSDQTHLKDHRDPIRSSGCCGKSGSEGPNRICRCLRAVATETSDCWTSYYLAFEPSKVKLVIVQVDP